PRGPFHIWGQGQRSLSSSLALASWVPRITPRLFWGMKLRLSLIAAQTVTDLSVPARFFDPEKTSRPGPVHSGASKFRAAPSASSGLGSVFFRRVSLRAQVVAEVCELGLQSPRVPFAHDI
ncbi:hypothetical protein, partial [Bradyrhizobium genomosp. III]